MILRIDWISPLTAPPPIDLSPGLPRRPMTFDRIDDALDALREPDTVELPASLVRLAAQILHTDGAVNTAAELRSYLP